MSKVFDYAVVSAFNELYYEDLLQTKHLVGEEIFLQKVKTPESENGYDECELNDFYYVLKRDRCNYLIPSRAVEDLPLKVVKSEKIGYKGSGYTLVKEYMSAKITAEKKMTFRSLVDQFANYSHSSPKDYLIYKLLCFSAIIDRINIRCSSAPGFGKDSVFNLIGDLFGGVAIVQKPTIAKLEYLSLNKVLICNEMANLTKAEKEEIENYLLAVGDFSNSYTKRSRASSDYGGREEFDISKLSLGIMYNDLECYPPGSNYFDDLFQRAVLERFPAFRFKGKIDHEFEHIADPVLIAQQNKEYFVSLIRTVQYFKENWRTELNDWQVPDFGLNVRGQKVFNAFGRMANLYANSREEFEDLLNTLYNRTVDYRKMVEKNPTLINPIPAKKPEKNTNFDGTPIIEEEI